MDKEKSPTASAIFLIQRRACLSDLVYPMTSTYYVKKIHHIRKTYPASHYGFSPSRATNTTPNTHYLSHSVDNTVHNKVHNFVHKGVQKCAPIPSRHK